LPRPKSKEENEFQSFLSIQNNVGQEVHFSKSSSFLIAILCFFCGDAEGGIDLSRWMKE
jgi:hypothetical protein